MTAATPLVESTTAIFLVPPSESPPAEQVRAYQEERDRLVAWIAGQIETQDQPGQVNDLIPTAEAARRTALHRRLGPEAVLAAQEVARRAERALHICVEAARRRGELIRRGHNRGPGGTFQDSQGRRQLADYGIRGTALANFVRIYAQDGHVFTDDEFDRAIGRCITVGSLAREPLEGVLGDILVTREGSDKITRMRALAAEGYTSAQMATELGMSVDYLRRLIKSNNLVVPGDQVTYKRRNVSPDKIIGRVVELVEGATSSLEIVDSEDYQALPAETRTDYARSVAASIRTLRAMHKELTNSVD